VRGAKHESLSIEERVNRQQETRKDGEKWAAEEKTTGLVRGENLPETSKRGAGENLNRPEEEADRKWRQGERSPWPFPYRREPNTKKTKHG